MADLLLEPAVLSTAQKHVCAYTTHAHTRGLILVHLTCTRAFPPAESHVHGFHTAESSRCTEEREGGQVLAGDLSLCWKPGRWKVGSCQPRFSSYHPVPRVALRGTPVPFNNLPHWNQSPPGIVATPPPHLPLNIAPSHFPQSENKFQLQCPATVNH